MAMCLLEELSKEVSHSSVPYVILHGSFAKPSRQELSEVAALRAGQPKGAGYRSQVRCDAPDAAEISDDENRKAPPAAEVFAHLERSFALGKATVVMWGAMAYRFAEYARLKQLDSPFSRTRVVDLQTAAVLHFNFKTSQCNDPRNVLRLLNPTAEPGPYIPGTLPFAHAMSTVLGKLLAAGWTPDSTPGAVWNGSEIGEQTEDLRIERWEQIRERQNNLGIERHPLPEVPQAYVVLDGEHVSMRQEKFTRLIEVAFVVAHRHENTYRLDDKPYTSLVQVQDVDDANPYAWKITGINPEAVRTAPPLARVIEEMTAVAPWDRGVLVTWGPDDAQVITQNCVKEGIPSPITEVPLLNLQRAFGRFYEQGAQQVGLQNAAAFLGIDTAELDLHRALADTVVTWRILERMLQDGWTPHWRPWHGKRVL